MSDQDSGYGEGREIPLAEIAGEVAARHGIQLEVYSDRCVGFTAIDREENEEVDILFSSHGGTIDLDFNAEGSRINPIELKTRGGVARFIEGIMLSYLPEQES